jgi:hypothetical protein
MGWFSHRKDLGALERWGQPVKQAPKSKTKSYAPGGLGSSGGSSYDSYRRAADDRLKNAEVQQKRRAQAAARRAVTALHRAQRAGDRADRAAWRCESLSTEQEIRVRHAVSEAKEALRRVESGQRRCMGLAARADARGAEAAADECARGADRVEACARDAEQHGR